MTSTPLRQRLCVILVRTQGPVNLGMICRLCGNTGINDLRLVAPQCPVNCAESRMFANHERHRVVDGLATFPDLPAAVADCGLVIGTSGRNREDDFGPPVSLPAVGTLIAQRPAERIAIVLGNEADGLSTAELRCCQAFVHLATPGPYSSYNLAAAAAIILHHLATLDLPEADDEQAMDPAAPRVHIDRLIDYWLGPMERFRYFRRTKRDRWEPHFRDMINRWHLTRHDIDVLFGMLAQLNYHCYGDRGDHLDTALARNPDPEPDLEPSPLGPAGHRGITAHHE